MWVFDLGTRGAGSVTHSGHRRDAAEYSTKLVPYPAVFVYIQIRIARSAKRSAVQIPITLVSKPLFE